MSTPEEIQDELRMLIETAAKRWVAPRELPPDPIKIRGVPHEHRWCRSATPDDLKRYADPLAVDRAAALPDVPHMVTLHGEQGSGKSTIGTWLLARAARSLPLELSYWTSVADLSIAYSEAPSKRSCVEAEHARGAAVVLLDDLGQEAQTESSRELVADIVARRHARHLTTIVTTGLTSQQIQARYGGGVLRRLTEAGRSHVLGCRGRR